MDRQMMALALALAAMVLTATTAEARNLHRIIRHSDAETTYAVGESAKALCKNADFPKLCGSISQTVHKLTEESLTEASIQAAVDKATAAKGVVAELMASPEVNKVVKNNLDVCLTNFGDTVDDLNEAIKYLKAESRMDVLVHISAAVSYLETCNDAFSETPEEVSPIAHVNSNLQKLVSNSLALADTFMKKD